MQIEETRSIMPDTGSMPPKKQTLQVSEDAATIHEALEMFRQARVKGLESFESVRRALAAGRIRSFKASGQGHPGRPSYRIKISEIERVIALDASEDRGGVHKRLIDFYRADPLHNPILAVSNGLTKSIDEAARVFRLFSKHAADVSTFEAREKQRAWEAEQAAKAAEEKPCGSCSRVYFLALRESATLVAEVTGNVPSLQTAQFELNDSKPLAAYTEWQCVECGLWREKAPAIEMRKTLANSREALAQEETISPEVH